MTDGARRDGTSNPPSAGPEAFAERVRSGGRPLFGTWVKIAAPEVIELLAAAGFDYVIVDLEHSPMTLRDVSSLIAVARGAGVPALVRVPDHSPTVLGQVLDCGAGGVVVPQVDSPDEASAVARACRFPPAGERGAGATTRAGSWGLASFGSYVSAAESALVVVQLESTAALASAVDIATVAGVDAVMFGPQDLALSSGFSPAAASDAIASAEARLTAAGVPLGIAVGRDATSVRGYAARGYRLVVASNDASILGLSARDLVEQFR